jgi:hypothetical protein
MLSKFLLFLEDFIQCLIIIGLIYLSEEWYSFLLFIALLDNVFEGFLFKDKEE